MRAEEYISVRISELCQKHQYTKYRLSQLTGISQTALGKVLSNESTPSIPTLEKICDAFGISLAQFFAGENEAPDLTKEQKEVLKIWGSLDKKEQKMLRSFLQSMRS